MYKGCAVFVISFSFPTWCQLRGSIQVLCPLATPSHCVLAGWFGSNRGFLSPPPSSSPFSLSSETQSLVNLQRIYAGWVPHDLIWISPLSLPATTRQAHHIIFNDFSTLLVLSFILHLCVWSRNFTSWYYAVTARTKAKTEQSGDNLTYLHTWPGDKTIQRTKQYKTNGRDSCFFWFRVCLSVSHSTTRISYK